MHEAYLDFTGHPVRWEVVAPSVWELALQPADTRAFESPIEPIRILRAYRLEYPEVMVEFLPVDSARVLDSPPSDRVRTRFRELSTVVRDASLLHGGRIPGSADPRRREFVLCQQEILSALTQLYFAVRDQIAEQRRAVLIRDTRGDEAARRRAKPPATRPVEPRREPRPKAATLPSTPPAPPGARKQEGAAVHAVPAIASLAGGEIVGVRICAKDRARFDTMELYDWQRDAAAAWVASGGRGIVEAVTGSGKTRVGLALIKDHLGQGRQHRVVVVVPTIDLMRQWRTALAEWLRLSPSQIQCVGTGEFGSAAYGRVAVYVAQSAALRLSRDIGRLDATDRVLLVADECHRFGAPSLRSILAIRWAATLGLSATPERTHDLAMEQHVIPRLGPIVYRYAHEAALSDGVIADFQVAFVALELTARERTEYDRLTERIIELRRAVERLHPGLRKAGKEYFSRLKALADAHEEPAVLGLLGAIQERRRLLVEASQRHEFLEWLAPRLPRAWKVIAFHESIGAAKQVASALTAVGRRAGVHHSQLPRGRRAEVLDDFKYGVIRTLVAPRTLDEGIDVPDANIALLVASTGVGRQKIQRIGRVLRRADGKARASILVLYIADTREDPHTRPEGDQFAEAMERLDRATYLAWPSEASALDAWLGVRQPVTGRVR